MSYRYGYVRLTGAQAPGWLGVKNDGAAIGNVLANGGIPINTAQWVINGNGTLDRIDFAHVWVQVQIAGVNYVFDPSIKQHAVTAGLTNLASVMGYTQSQFLLDAGGTVDSVSISNIDRSNLRLDLTTYASNLVGYIQGNNPGWAVSNVVGGKSIQYLTASPLRQTSLPDLSPSQPSGFPHNWGSSVPNAYRTCFTLSMPGVTKTACGSASGQTIQLYSDQTYGHRITVFSVPSGSLFVPTLLIDGAPPPNGQNTGTAVASGVAWSCATNPSGCVNVEIRHPYSGPVNQSGALNLVAGGSYLIGAGWGQVNCGTIEKHRTLLAQAIAAGNAASSEVVLGESLAVISYSWLAEEASEQRLGDGLASVTTQYHHGVGITGQSAIQTSGVQGPYVDLPLNFLTIQPQTYASGSLSPATIGAFFTDSGVSSSLESAVLEQTQALVAGMQAASTVRLVDLNAATAAKTFFADGTTTAGLATYFSSIQGNLTGYSSADLTFINNSISSNGLSSGSPTGKQVLLPVNGDIGVGLWNGAGYTVSTMTSTTLSVLQKISGGLSGGYSGTSVPVSSLTSSTLDQMQPASGYVSIPLGVTAASPAPSDFTIAEPVDSVTGAYIYDHSDLSTGRGGFPYALAFARTYTSSSNTDDVGLGNGWTHNFSVSASRGSDPFTAMGDSSPARAAAAIAALYVSQDLLSGTKSVQPVTIAWMVDRWLTDQLTNNAVTISWPGTNEAFTLLPRLDGSSSAAYGAPLGSAVVLTGSAPDSYGNFTTFAYLNKDQSRLTFNPVNATTLTGQIAGWSFPNGMGVSFAYNGSNQLIGVSNTLGRSLTLAYSGAPAHIATVTDDTGRSIAYGYSGSNLATFTDPLTFKSVFAYDGASHLTQVFYPSQPSNAFVTNSYDTLGRVNAQANANGNVTSFYFAGSRTETVDPAGDRHVTYQTARGKVLKDDAVLSGSFGDVFNDTAQQNGVINVTASQYDGQDRLTLTTAPEGGTVALAYSTDFLNNVVQVTRTAKPGSGLTPLVTTYGYDPIYNKPVLVTDPLGLVATMSYDPATGNLLTAVADVGGAGHFNARSSFTWTSVGLPLTATDPLGVISRYVYDSLGDPTSITRDYGHLNLTTAMGYSRLGDMISLTDPNLNVYASAYDADRRLMSSTMPGAPGAPGGRTAAIAYDPDGRVLQTQISVGGAVQSTTFSTYTLAGEPATATDANGNVTRYAYDVVDRVASVTDPLNRVTSFGYDALSRRTGVFNTAIQAGALWAQAYTPDGLAASVTDANAHSTGYVYDGFDRLGTTTWPDSSTEALAYDADSNVPTRKTRKGDTLTLTYDTLNRPATKAAPSEATVTYAFDLDSRLIGASDTSAAVTTPATSASYAATYTYDALNRPITAVWTPAPAQTLPTAATVTFTHAYDATNRRIGQTASDNGWWSYPTTAQNISYTPNSLNQYSAVGSASPTYDGNGNLTFDGALTYGYDAESRLTSIAQGGVTQATYAYDAQGRRKSKTVGSTTTLYVTDADNREVLEYAGTGGAPGAWYAFGPGPDAVLNRMNVAASSRQTMIPDIQGSIIGALDSGGTLTKAGFQPYGENPTVTTGSFRYTGRRIDPETGGSAPQPSGLYYYRARMYSPAWGRFLQPDPAGYEVGTNLYAYAANDPLDLADPSGERPGDWYSSPQAAALAAINDINPTSVRQGMEYAGRVYALPFNIAYSYTAPSAGTMVNSCGDVCISSPFYATDVGLYHTHGNQWTGENGTMNFPNQFSGAGGDINLYNQHNLLGFVGTPNGGALEYDSSTGATTSIGRAALPNPPVGPIAGPTPQQLQQMENQQYGNQKTEVQNNPSNQSEGIIGGASELGGPAGASAPK